MRASVTRPLLFLALALSAAALPASAAEPYRVTPSDLHLEHLRPAQLSYLVYMHAGPGSGIKRPVLANFSVSRQTVDGTPAWVITHAWEDPDGTVHTARTVHAASDIATLSQDATWVRSGQRMSSHVVPARGEGRAEGEWPEAARQCLEAGFQAMQDGWWMNWHSDLTLLPLLPYEKGGTLRIRLFDVGMPAPLDVDYTVLGERTLAGADGRRYDCWLVETESGNPGGGAFQRFWIDKASRVVVKEEDNFNGQYRSKYLLAVPVSLEFPAPEDGKQG